jgi:hypothetical protein
MRRNGVQKRASRISERIFDWAIKRNRRVALMALAAPALVTGLVVTVHSGNTLSGLAAQYCGATHTNDWTGIYAANKATIGSNPNLILIGQNLVIPKCDDPPQLLALGSTNSAPSTPSSGRVYGITYGDPNYCGDGDRDGWDVSCQTVHSAPAPNPVTQGGTYSGTYSGGGGFQSCVISRESGGNSQIMNSSGHYGLYQFSASTWAAYGGNPADFGNASVAEQNQIFNNAIAAGGQSNWAPYDGC